MKKLLIAIGFVLSIQFSYAQKSAYSELPDRLYTQGKEMFHDNNYTGCINTLQEFKKVSKDAKLNAEADYMIVSSHFYQGKENVGNQLKDFLEEYPDRNKSSSV